MSTPDEHVAPGAEGPIDALDLAILEDVAQVYEAVDPVPAGLVDRVRFAMAHEEVMAEIMRLEEEIAVALSARGDERSRTFRFSSSLVTMVIRAIGVDDGTVRVDGWVAPPGPYRVTLRHPGGRVDRRADDHGRFVFEEFPAGVAQLIVRPTGRVSGVGKTLATPAVVL
jgi:hypothetical protein